jgi:AraC-like DNA-binding protein
MENLLESMGSMVERHAHERRQATPIPGLTLYRADQPMHPAHTLYQPRVVVLLRGSKSVSAGEAPFLADTSTFLLVTVDLPVATCIHLAPDGRSHLALTLDIDRRLLAETMQRVSPASVTASRPAGVVAAPMSSDLLEAFSRLLALLDHPADVAFIAPLILQEIYYRVFRSAVGGALTQLALSSSHLSQISRVTHWIRTHYNRPMSIDALAEAASMSVTSFHRHFKAITLMTPVQYRTQIRLQEARRLMIVEGKPAGVVAVSVGYDTQSQFTRDYKRLFGAPPATDAARVSGQDARA